MRTLSPRRRRLVVLCTLPASLSGAFGTMHQHLAGRPHQGLFMGLYLGGLCALIAFAIRESIALRRDEGCGRA